VPLSALRGEIPRFGLPSHPRPSAFIRGSCSPGQRPEHDRPHGRPWGRGGFDDEDDDDDECVAVAGQILRFSRRMLRQRPRISFMRTSNGASIPWRKSARAAPRRGS